MSKKKTLTEPVQEKVEAPEQEEVRYANSPIQRVKLANSLANVLDDKNFNELVHSMPNGEYILELFIKAAEDEIERIMTGESAPIELVNEASEKVEQIVGSCLRLQEQLVALVKGRMTQQRQQQPVQQVPQQQRPQQQPNRLTQAVKQRTAQPQQQPVRGVPIYEQPVYQEQTDDENIYL